ncbi:MAG: Uma2 family endonuclease, partial [Leptolyngbyaceae bacterium]|nr:Uma2 family endonuclease [Leptolyngbyaceae bacterium]
EDWAGFRLQGGRYEEITLDAQGQLISQILELALVRWQGVYKGIETTWLRWAQLDGTVLRIPDEELDRERYRTEQERQRAEQAETQVAQIVRNLLQNGMEIAQVSQMTGLTVAQVESLQLQ